MARDTDLIRANLTALTPCSAGSADLQMGTCHYWPAPMPAPSRAGSGVGTLPARSVFGVSCSASRTAGQGGQ